MNKPTPAIIPRAVKTVRSVGISNNHFMSYHIISYNPPSMEVTVIYSIDTLFSFYFVELSIPLLAYSTWTMETCLTKLDRMTNRFIAVSYDNQQEIFPFSANRLDHRLGHYMYIDRKRFKNNSNWF